MVLLRKSLFIIQIYSMYSLVQLWPSFCTNTKYAHTDRRTAYYKAACSPKVVNLLEMTQENYNMWMVFVMYSVTVPVTSLGAGPVTLRCDGTRSWVASRRPHIGAVALPDLTAPYSTCLDARAPRHAYAPPSTSHRTVTGLQEIKPNSQNTVDTICQLRRKVT
jgi:hypothetical protein